MQNVQTGRLGANPTNPLIESRRTIQEKPPWKTVPSLRRNMESEFLYPLYLGESIAPFRVLSPILSVVPWDSEQNRLLSSSDAQSHGYAFLAGWLAEAEQIWSKHGSGRRTLLEQLDYFGQLTAQFPIASMRVVYSASGTLPAATILADPHGIAEHKLYWIKADSLEEGRYLLSILNSETARQNAEHLQSRGQWGARDFDKAILSLPIPQFDNSNKLHKALEKAAAHAEKVAATVQLKEKMHFIRARKEIRNALHDDGIAEKIDALVAELLKISIEA